MTFPPPHQSPRKEDKHAFVSKIDQRYPFLWKMQSGKCFYCGRPLKLETKQGDGHSLATVDHFFPKKYGHTRQKNIVIACKQCNTSSMHALPTEEEIARFALIPLDAQARKDSDNAPILQMPVYPRRSY